MISQLLAGTGSHRIERRRAATLLELLIAIAIIGVLLSIAVPAVHRAVERSRQMACANNLRQIGLAAHAHLSAHRAFPYNSTLWLDDSRQHLAISPHRHLLAGIDRNLYERIDFDDPSAPVWAPTPPVFASTNNQKISRVSVPAFACPSDSIRSGGVSYRANVGISAEILSPSRTIEQTAHRGAFGTVQKQLPEIG